MRVVSHFHKFSFRFTLLSLSLPGFTIDPVFIFFFSTLSFLLQISFTITLFDFPFLSHFYFNRELSVAVVLRLKFVQNTFLSFFSASCVATEKKREREREREGGTDCDFLYFASLMCFLRGTHSGERAPHLIFNG